MIKRLFKFCMFPLATIILISLMMLDIIMSCFNNDIFRKSYATIFGDWFLDL